MYFRIRSWKFTGDRIEGLFRDHEKDDNIFISFLAKSEIKEKLEGLLNENHNVSFSQIRKSAFSKSIETYYLTFFQKTKIYSLGKDNEQPVYYNSLKFALYNFYRRIGLWI